MTIIDVNGNKRECVKIYPDPQWPGYMKVEYQNAVRKHSEWYPIEDFIKNNPDLAHLTTNAKEVVEETLGIVTSSTKTSLKDSTRNWQKNMYTGLPIWISRGKGEGQVRKVVSNNKNTVTIDKPWDKLPNKTSQYVISQNIPESVKAWGNTLSVIEKRI